MPTTGGAPRPGSSSKGERVTRLFQQALNPDRAERDEAFRLLYEYVAHGPVKDRIAACVKRRAGPVAVTEAINDAVASLFVGWGEFPVNDTSHYNALVVRTVFWKLTAQRRADRRFREALSEKPAGGEPDAALDAALERFEDAVEKLAEHELAEYRKAGSPPGVSPTPLADVVQARHLTGGDHTFTDVADVLRIKPATANKRYWRALEWIHANVPDALPKLPEKKKSGRRKASDGEGGAP